MSSTDKKAVLDQEYEKRLKTWKYFSDQEIRDTFDKLGITRLPYDEYLRNLNRFLLNQLQHHERVRLLRRRIWDQDEQQDRDHWYTADTVTHPAQDATCLTGMRRGSDG